MGKQAMSSDLQSSITTALSNAYSETADPETGALLGEWVLTAETYGEDGEPYLHTIRSKGLTAWKALGMLESHAEDLKISLGPS